MRMQYGAMGDIGYGLMAWANIIAIALLAPKAVALLKDYEKQRKRQRIQPSIRKNSESKMRPEPGNSNKKR